MARRPLRESRPILLHPSAAGRVVGRHGALLADPKILSWWEARSLRSRLSADTYLRQLGFLLERIELDPSKVVALAKNDPDQLRDLLVRYAARMKREGRLDSYISKFFEGLKSFLKFQHVTFDGFPSLSPIKGESLATERVPTPEELASVLERLSLRSRTCALFMAHSGLRPGVLGAYQAEAGLTLGDLPDLDVRGPKFGEHPFSIRVPAHLSKTRAAYLTFGSAQLEAVLLAYLRGRREIGERLTPESPVIAVHATRGVAERRRADPRYARGFVVTKAIVQEIHDALSEAAPAGTRWRPYVLRSFASTRLLLAEGAGKITRDLREALLGHDTGISGRYSVGKRWGAELLKEARSSYKRCEPFLSTSGSRSSEERDLQTRRVVLRMQGYTEEELSKIDLASKTDDELIALADAKRLEGQRPGGVVQVRNGQKAVPISEVGKLLEAGWEYVGPLGSDQAILRNTSASAGTAWPR